LGFGLQLGPILALLKRQNPIEEDIDYTADEVQLVKMVVAHPDVAPARLNCRFTVMAVRLGFLGG
jgi:hypothetical protein